VRSQCNRNCSRQIGSCLRAESNRLYLRLNQALHCGRQCSNVRCNLHGINGQARAHCIANYQCCMQQRNICHRYMTAFQRRLIRLQRHPPPPPPPPPPAAAWTVPRRRRTIPATGPLSPSATCGASRSRVTYCDTNLPMARTRWPPNRTGTLQTPCTSSVLRGDACASPLARFCHAQYMTCCHFNMFFHSCTAVRWYRRANGSRGRTCTSHVLGMASYGTSSPNTSIGRILAQQRIYANQLASRCQHRAHAMRKKKGMRKKGIGKKGVTHAEGVSTHTEGPSPRGGSESTRPCGTPAMKTFLPTHMHEY